MASPQPFTGRTRLKRTHWTVWAGEVLSRVFITVGGIGTILAICLIGFFLLWTVFPLFLPARLSDEEQLPPPATQPIRVALDEDQVAGWALYPQGSLQLFRLDNGKPVGEPYHLDGPGAPTAVSGPGAENDWLFGFADGTVRDGSLRWTTDFVDAGQLPPELRDLPLGESAEYQGGILRRASGNLFRLRGLGDVQTHKLALHQVQSLGSPIRRLDHVALGSNELRYAVLTGDGKLRVVAVHTEKRFGKKEPQVHVEEQEASLRPTPGTPNGKGPPDHVLLDGTGLALFAIWNDGLLYRYNLGDFPEHPPRLEEELSLLDGRQDLHVTTLQFAVGRATLLVGDSSGRIRAWFATRPDNAATPDKIVLQAGHTFEGQGPAVTALAASDRDRTLLAGYADGSVHAYYITSEKYLAHTATANQPIGQVALAPRNDGLLAVSEKGMWHWRLDLGHPEATPAALFLPVWYENYPAPEAVWQSSGAGGSEIKLGLWPLVFGTLKATFYSLMIGVPLALLAAVYTSEFLHPKLKTTIKPTVELMAGLPSVVLGFLAAFVIAPFVNHVVPAALAALVTVPAMVLLGAFLWQLLPDKVSLPLQRSRIAFIFLALLLGIAVAIRVGPVLEQVLFGGDIKRWLSWFAVPGTQQETPRFGPAWGGWFVLLLPFSGIAVAVFLSRVVNQRLRRLTADWSHVLCALVDLVKFLVAAVLTVLLAGAVGLGLQALGFDPRGQIPGLGSFLGVYEQKNSLIVGFVMGFAIIPIIYTIAEDALSAVPEHLRSASLGCGATRWQTAVNIIIPTAMSGLFSAVMIGLGRAVGETMIVLMAAGATPLKDVNIFNGFRTLSAAIAIEMPEAARGSTHYRTLYLAGLVLFAITFVLNTAAELVRQRFRRRAYQL